MDLYTSKRCSREHTEPEGGVFTSGRPRISVFAAPDLGGRQSHQVRYGHEIFRAQPPEIYLCHEYCNPFEYLKKMNIFDKNKIFVLRDPAINLHEFSRKKKEKIKN